MAALAAVRMQGRTLKANLNGGPAPKKSKADLKMELYGIDQSPSRKGFRDAAS